MQKKMEKAETLFKSAEEKGVQEPLLYKKLAMIYQKMGREDLVELNLKKYQDLRDRQYFPETRENYNAVVKEVLGRGKSLISMQYPMRSIAPLQDIMQDNKKIVFIENKTSFQNLLKTNAFSEIFEDSFAGDFGHCTRKGNRLIVESLTQVIFNDILRNP